MRLPRATERAADLRPVAPCGCSQGSWPPRERERSSRGPRPRARRCRRCAAPPGRRARHPAVERPAGALLSTPAGPPPAGRGDLPDRPRSRRPPGRTVRPPRGAALRPTSASPRHAAAYPPVGPHPAGPERARRPTGRWGARAGEQPVAQLHEQRRPVRTVPIPAVGGRGRPARSGTEGGRVVRASPLRAVPRPRRASAGPGRRVGDGSVTAVLRSGSRPPCPRPTGRSATDRRATGTAPRGGGSGPRTALATTVAARGGLRSGHPSGPPRTGADAAR